MVDMGRVVELGCSLRGGLVSARGSRILLAAVNAELPALKENGGLGRGISRE